jgi:hypothetical protein
MENVGDAGCIDGGAGVSDGVGDATCLPLAFLPCTDQTQYTG